MLSQWHRLFGQRVLLSRNVSLSPPSGVCWRKLLLFVSLQDTQGIKAFYKFVCPYYYFLNIFSLSL